MSHNVDSVGLPAASLPRWLRKLRQVHEEIRDAAYTAETPLLVRERLLDVLHELAQIESEAM